MARPRAKLARCGEAARVRRRLNTEPPGAPVGAGRNALRVARLHPARLGFARPPAGRAHPAEVSWGFVYGALSVGLSRTEFLLTETMDQAHSVAFYRTIRRGDPAALHVLIQDGAGFHLRDGTPGLPDNVRVVTLPAYSPELNPIGGLWDQIKDRLCNWVFDTLPELEAGLQTGHTQLNFSEAAS